ncbi:MAG: hypothetical protein WBN89_07205 [Prochlorococcaceae cyanobacterium]
MRASQRLQRRSSSPSGQPSPFHISAVGTGPAATAPAVSAGTAVLACESGPTLPLSQRPALIEAGAAASLSQERRDYICSLVGLTVKLGLVLMAGVSLVRLAGAYQERMDRQGELAAVLQLEQGKVAKARERFDTLFSVEGEQRLIREQNQWIAPNRLRVVWKQPSAGNSPSTGDGADTARTGAAVGNAANPGTER